MLAVTQARRPLTGIVFFPAPNAVHLPLRAERIVSTASSSLAVPHDARHFIVRRAAAGGSIAVLLVRIRPQAEVPSAPREILLFPERVHQLIVQRLEKIRHHGALAGLDERRSAPDSSSVPSVAMPLSLADCWEARPEI